MGIKEKIEALRNQLHEHNRKYYIDDAPVISDYEFDMLLKELESLEALIRNMLIPTVLVFE